MTTQNETTDMPLTEHKFAQYVRLLGKGKTGSRNLTYQESKDAMTMILKGEVEPEQLGAFMMLMRYQEESAEELAGFVDATYDVLDVPENMPTVDLDWSSYAGKARRLPWFILSTLLLAENGISILMHGEGHHTQGRIYTEQVLKLLNIPIAHSFEEAGEHITARNFAYLPLHDFLPELARIMNLKWILGLRSPVNTFTRLINPCRAKCSMQGIHHPAYRDTHQEASLLLKQPVMAVIKGDGGETEWNPDMKNLVRSIKNGQLIEEEWSPLFPKRHVKDKVLDPSKLANVWDGSVDDEYGVAAIIGTTAITLYTMSKADSHEAALEMAKDWWENRKK
ncbi:MAG TPA: glycosyl transferase family protein [Leucothrix mucor]|uniref:Glycosyl transferase family protein n=1 Tax=Leucothrix mucor TaxID=45248 RepID=A0A7V2T2W7_LEUMU|nr:glycosyl transferase family protein [Leucothrix mucor]